MAKSETQKNTERITGIEQTDPAEGLIQMPTVPPPDTVRFDLPTGPPAFEGMLERLQPVMMEAGYTQEDIQQLYLPGQGVPGFVKEGDAGGFTSMMDEFFSRPENTKAIAEALDLQKQNHEKYPDQEIDFGSTSILRAYALQWGKDGMVNLGTANRWLNQARRGAARFVANEVGDAIINMDHALLALDGLTWLNKKWKAEAVPEHLRDEWMERMLPEIQLPGYEGLTFGSGFMAGMYLWQERTVGTLQSWAGGLGGALFGAVGAHDLEDASKEMFVDGVMRKNKAKNVIVPLMGMIGEYKHWNEVQDELDRYEAEDTERVLRKFNPDMPDDPQTGYEDHWAMRLFRAWDDITMTIGNELVNDPLIIGGMALKNAPRIGRKAMDMAADIAPEEFTKAYNASRMEVTLDKANRTKRFDDAVTTLEAATRRRDAAVKHYEETKAAQGQVSMDDVRELAQAERQYRIDKQVLDGFKDVGPHTPILLRAPQSALPPPPPTVVETYIERMSPTGVGLAAKWKKADEVANLTRQVENYEKWYKGSQKYMDEATEAQAQVKLQDLKDELRWWEARPTTYTEKYTGNVWVTREEERAKMVKEVADDLAEQATIAGQNPRPHPLTEDPAQLDLFRRRALGPDDAEIAGDGLYDIIRTGGVSVDETVVMGSTAPQYSTNPARGEISGLIDTRLHKLRNDITKEERAWLRTGEGRQLDMFNTLPKQAKENASRAKKLKNLWLSAERLMWRQESIQRQNYGAARRRAHLGNARKYEREFQRMRDVRKKLVAERKAWRKENPDEVLKQMGRVKYLPVNQPPIQEDPTRFNQFMRTMGDKWGRGLTPGSMVPKRLSSMFNSHGDAISNLREPMRFLERHSPETWRKLRNAVLRHDQERDLFIEKAMTAAEEAGLVFNRARRTGWNPKKHFAPHEIDPERDKLAATLLNTIPGTDEHNAARELAQQKFPSLLKFHRTMRIMFDQLAQQQGIAGTERYLEGYLRATTKVAAFRKGARPAEYIGITRKGASLLGHLMDRKGPVQIDSAMEAIELYARNSYRAIIMEPMYAELEQVSEELVGKVGPHAATYMNDLVNQLKGKPSFLAQRLDDQVAGIRAALGQSYSPGQMERQLAGISGLIWAGTLPGNPRYPVMQIATAIATTTGRFGIYRTARGLMQMATPEGRAIARAAGTDRMFEQVFESNTFRQFSAFMGDLPTPSPVGAWSTSATENFIRGMTFHAAVDLHLNKLGFATLKEAQSAGMIDRIVFESLRASEEVNHLFGPLGKSPFISRLTSNATSTFFTQFLSFMPKQSEELVAMGVRQGPGAIMEYMGMSGALARNAAMELGVDLSEYVGFGYLPKEGRDIQSPGSRLLQDALLWGASATELDKAGMAQHGESLLRGLPSLFPGYVALNTAMKAGQRYMSGEVTSSKGEKMRELDFKDDMPELEQTFLDHGWVAGMKKFQEIMEQKTSTLMGQPVGVGSDIFPTLTGQMNIKDRMFYAAMDTKRKRERDKVYQLDEYTRQVSSLLADKTELSVEDQEKFATIVKLAAADGIPIPTDRVMAQQYAALVSYAIRHLESEDLMGKIELLRVLEAFGVEVTP
jgi:hypothetical protein